MNGVGQLSSESGKCTLRYTWKIDNFYHYYNRYPNQCLTSPAFSTPHSNNAQQWRIKFYPQNASKEFQNYSAVFLTYFGEGEVAIKLEFSFSSEYCTSLIQLNARKLGVQLFNPQTASYGFQDFIERTESMTRYEKIFITCEVSFDLPLAVPQTVSNVTNQKNDSQGCSSQNDSQADFGNLFETELLSDVTVTIGQKKKPLHKAILANGSEVFRAMFQHDMTEKKESVVDIVDIKMEVAMAMFRYMYTGRVNDIEKLSVDELLIAAEKYAITGLKAICQNALCTNLNFDNALQYLTLASMHNSDDLKTKVMEFIVKYLDKFVDKPEFKTLDQSITCELLSAVAKKKY